MNEPPPLKGPGIRIPIIIPIKGRGVLIRGLHYYCIGFWYSRDPFPIKAGVRRGLGFRV